MVISQSVISRWRVRGLAALSIVVFAILIRLPLLMVPITWSSDIWRQTDTAAIARLFWRDGFHLFYPQIYWGGAGPGYVETEFQLYPFIVALLYQVFGEHVWLGRLVSLVFTVPTLVFFWGLTRRLLPQRPALIALAIFVVLPVYVRYSLAFMPEATVMCFYVLSLYLFQKWLDGGLDGQQTKWLLLAALSTALTILVKPTSIHIGLIFAMMALWRLGWRVLLQPRVWLAVLVVLVPVVLYYRHAQTLYLQYGNTFGVLSGGDDKFGTLAMRLSLLWYLEVSTLFRWLLLGLPGVPLILIGIVVSMRRRQPVSEQGPQQGFERGWILCGIFTMLLYLFIVARYAAIAPNYYVYLAPYVAWGIAVGIEWVWSWRRWLGIASTLLTVVWMIASGAGQMFIESQTLGVVPLEACGKRVNRLTPPGALISVTTFEVSVHPDGAPNNYQEPVVFFFADRHGLTLPPEWRTPEKLEAQHKAGMQYVVVHDKEFLTGFPNFAEYLRTQTERIATKEEASGNASSDGSQETSCEIYKFKS